MSVICDIDGVLANIIIPWLKRYNLDYEDNLVPDNITDWNTHLFVKESCGDKIYDYIKDPSLYDEVLPIENALTAVNLLRDQGQRILFVTAFEPGFSYAKYDWLIKYGFLTDKNDYFECNDKKMIKAGCLIDDNIQNVSTFSELGILYSAPWNIKYDYRYRLSGWNKIIEFLNKEKQ